MSNYMIGIDIGTTSTKSVLFTEQGAVVSTCTQEYPLYTPAPDVAEQDPEQIVQAAVRSIRGVMDESGVSANEILFVSWGSAMQRVLGKRTFAYLVALSAPSPLRESALPLLKLTIAVLNNTLVLWTFLLSFCGDASPESQSLLRLSINQQSVFWSDAGLAPIVP